MSTFSDALKRTLPQAKSKTIAKPMRFAFVSGRESALIISSSAVSPKDIAEAKKETGGSAVITGRCYGADGAVIFETPKSPPPTLAVGIKRCAKDAGVSVNVETRQQEEEEGSESESEEAPPVARAASASNAASASSAPSPAANKARVDKITVRVRALTAKAASNAAIKAKLAAAATAYRAANLDQAESLLDEAEEL